MIGEKAAEVVLNTRCRSEAAPRCFEVVVIEATAAGRTKISISAAHWSSWVE
jgi:hypothetical protein